MPAPTIAFESTISAEKIMKARAWPTRRTSGAVSRQLAMPPADSPVRIVPAQVGG